MRVNSSVGEFWARADTTESAHANTATKTTEERIIASNDFGKQAVVNIANPASKL